MRLRKLGSWVGRLVAVAAFGMGSIVGVAFADTDASRVVANPDAATDSTEWN
jgi:hypothetical protein